MHLKTIYGGPHNRTTSLKPIFQLELGYFLFGYFVFLCAEVGWELHINKFFSSRQFIILWVLLGGCLAKLDDGE